MKIMRKNRGAKMLLVAVAMTLLTSGCYMMYHVVYDPHKALAADWYAAITVEKGFPTACRTAYSTQFTGSGWQCRSVHGVEEAGDKTNYFVDPGGPDSISNEGILSVAGSSGSSNGAMLVMKTVRSSRVASGGRRTTSGSATTAHGSGQCRSRQRKGTITCWPPRTGACTSSTPSDVLVLSRVH